MSQDYEPLFRALFERTRSPAAIVDDGRRYVEVNSAAAEMLGVPRESLVGRSRHDFVPAGEHARFEANFERLLRDGCWNGVHEFQAPDGRRIALDVRAVSDVVPDRHLVLYAPAAPRSGPGLTPREREIVAYLAHGLTGEEIARRLFLSPETVRTHIRNAMERMGARTRPHLIALALRHRLLADIEV